MLATPARTEAAAHYFTYIDKAQTDDLLAHLDAQTTQLIELFSSISEEKSLHRYAPGKWSIREALAHINDTERVFVFRALFFARGNAGPLPGFDQDDFNAHAGADARPLSAHLVEFQAIRAATMAAYRSLTPEAWLRTGVASGNSITVRALAYATAGHAEHHRRILVEKYL